ncbi:MAG: ABC transporter permease [Pseudomonadota bacterium]
MTAIRLPESGRAPFALWPPLTLAVLVTPVVGGLLGTLLPAFGYLPALGLDRVSLAAFGELWLVPGLGTSIALALWVALGSTLLAFVLALAFVAGTMALPRSAWTRRLVTPLLAAPHVGVAVGLAFLLAPSGLLVRAASPWLTGWQVPPAWLFPGDPWGLALVFALVAKETPFLVLMILAGQTGIDADRRLIAARSLGHGPLVAWIVAVLPTLYPGLRLPLFAVLAYGFAPVDMAAILGPTVPPILGVRVVELLGDAQLARWPVGAAAALLLLALACLAMGFWRLLERPTAALGRRWLTGGPGRPMPALIPRSILTVAVLPSALALLGLATLPLWSVAGRWRFPGLWPDGLRFDGWSALGVDLASSVVVTLTLAVVVAGVAVALVVLCLEAETHRRRAVPPRAVLWLFLPLVVPQAAFLFGVQVLLAGLRVDGTVLAVAVVQLAFVVPYAFLTLAGPFRALDPRWALAARSLGRRPGEVLWRIKLPLLAAPLATALAVSVAVSVALYLPTMFAGSGRVRTLAVEAVALAGADRRSAGIVVTVLALIPLVAFAAAAVVRRRTERRR